MLKTNALSKTTSFKANLDGITEIQTRFLNEATRFVYFRKGEFDNIEDIIELVTKLLSLGLIIWNAIKVFKKRKPTKKNLVIRVIASRTPRNKVGLKQFERFGAGVSIIPKQKMGSIRFFINEKRYCFFLRRKWNDFFGIIGDDPVMRNELKKLFEREYDEHHL